MLLKVKQSVSLKLFIFCNPFSVTGTLGSFFCSSHKVPYLKWPFYSWIFCKKKYTILKTHYSSLSWSGFLANRFAGHVYSYLSICSVAGCISASLCESLKSPFSLFLLTKILESSWENGPQKTEIPRQQPHQNGGDPFYAAYIFLKIVQLYAV